MKNITKKKSILGEKNIQRFHHFLETKEIAPYHGIRVIAIFIIAWFHIWQQSWLMPYVKLGQKTIDLSFIVKSGYIFVDILILLSSFLCFLPYVKEKERNGSSLKSKVFYKKRIARIIPSYYFTIVFITLFLSLPLKKYGNNGQMIKDVLMHGTFTHTFSRATYYFTPINGVLWTLAIEVQGYLLFPLLAKIFIKKPIITYGTMIGFSFLYRFLVKTYCLDTSMWFNQLPAFIDVYANGMAGALILVKMKKHSKDSVKEKWIATAIAGLSVGIVVLLMMAQGKMQGQENIRRMQMEIRYILTLVAAVLLVALPFTFKGIQGILGNKGMKFFASISFNYYIWHQTVAVWLKKWHIPLSISNQPHIDGEKSWQLYYTFLSFALGLVVATILTFGIEKPVGKWIRKKMKE